MRKRLQNKVAESKIALPVVSVYTTVVWLLCGLITKEWWLQFGLLALTAFLTVELNNRNALIRVYSRMVNCTFLMLTCCACFLFPSLRGACTQLFFVSTILLLFMTYQNPSTGITYYAFLLFGLGSLTYVHVLYFVPLLWLLMLTNLQSLSWRTWCASVLGLLTPYWIGVCWLTWQHDYMPAIDFFTPLASFATPFRYDALPTGHQAVYAFLVILAITGIVHFIRQKHHDKIRIRQLYGFFFWTFVAAALFLAAQPQHYDMLIRIMIICVSPLAGHFLTLTNTKVTNIAFFVILAVTLVITAYNLWVFSSIS